MSRITCLIIFSGSSARSTMSLMFARIKVPTRSKSPMMSLLSKPNDANHSNLSKPIESACRPRMLNQGRKCRPQIPATNFASPSKETMFSAAALPREIDRACPKLVEYKTERHRHYDPNEEKIFFHIHAHPPQHIGLPVRLS